MSCYRCGQGHRRKRKSIKNIPYRVLAALDLDLSVIARRKTGFDPTEY